MDTPPILVCQTFCYVLLPTRVPSGVLSACDRLTGAAGDGIIGQPMRGAFFAVSIMLGSSIVAGQNPKGQPVDALLKRLFPEASSFSPRLGVPPHFKAYGPPTDAQAPVVGVAFWTTELEPLERGYDGPIKILVGMDLQGVLAGVVVVDHSEPYGYFSVDPAGFAAQFTRKNIRDPFKVGSDVDAVSKATITIGSASRAIRNSARRIARQVLSSGPGTP
jgi:transcriptional regulator of nitric oxide reductase